MTEKGLQLAHEKTEAILLAGARRRVCPATVKLGSRNVRLADKVKYLGVTIDKALTFRQHVGDASTRAMRAIGALSSLTKKTGKTHGAIRKLIMNTPRSMLLYAAPAFAHVISRGWASKEIISTQRNLKIRGSAAYRTVSADALDVITLTLPVMLEVKKRLLRFLLKDKNENNGLREFLDNGRDVASAVLRHCGPRDPSLEDLDEIFQTIWQ